MPCPLDGMICVRYFASLFAAFALVAMALWFASWLASGEWSLYERLFYSFGHKDICGYAIPRRLYFHGYDLDAWSDRSCSNLSEGEVCLLNCMSRGGAIDTGGGCEHLCGWVLRAPK